jgi:hypothetical protein
VIYDAQRGPDSRKRYSSNPRRLVSLVSKKKAKKNALEPPITRPAVEPASSAVKTLLNQPQPQFTPPIRVEFKSFEVLWIERDPFSLFIKFLGEGSLFAIIAATNARVRSDMGLDPQFARMWHELTRGEFLCWLGLLFYMGFQARKRRCDYWPLFRPFMSQYRWDQIHRYLTFNIAAIITSQSQSLSTNLPWWFRVEPVYSIVRENCHLAVAPSTWFAVDEAMISFSGRSRHIVKLPNKPIGQGYKAWVLGFDGYHYDWLLHSSVEGPEACYRKKSRVFAASGPSPTVSLTETFQVPLVLCERLIRRHPHREWLVFLDNLFLNVNVAHSLLKIGIGVMGTTRKNLGGFPRVLLEIKEINKALVYGGSLAVIEGETLCFAWQDNNVVLGMTTAFSLDREISEDSQPINYVLRERRRPKESSTNAGIARPVFGNEAFKTLSIPTAIDAYNHHMGGVDLANQLRQNFSSHRPFETRNWRPIAFWLFDVCLVNAFVIWRQDRPEKERKSCRLHELFAIELVRQLLRRGSPHQPGKLGKRRRCAWGARHPGECAQGAVSHKTERSERRIGRRRALSEIINDSRPSQRSKNVITGCLACGVNLCITRGCFHKWHVRLYEELV